MDHQFISKEDQKLPEIIENDDIWDLREKFLVNYQRARRAGLRLDLIWPDEIRQGCRCGLCLSYPQHAISESTVPKVSFDHQTIKGQIDKIPMHLSRDRGRRRFHRSLEFKIDLSSPDEIIYTRLEKDDINEWGSQQVFQIKKSGKPSELSYENLTKDECDWYPPPPITPVEAEKKIFVALESFNNQLGDKIAQAIKNLFC